MLQLNKIFIVDENCSRRAAVAFELSKGGQYVLPLENMEELFRLPPDSSPILVHDKGDAVSAAVKLARRHLCWAPLIAFDEVCDPYRVTTAAHCGALDYLLWPFTFSDFERSVNRSQEPSAKILQWRARQEESLDRVKRLSSREQEVLSQVVDGLSSREIGQKLGISPRTAEIHRAHAIEKLDARGTFDAIRIWVEGRMMA
jgi:FixJ family two-component response regulator